MKISVIIPVYNVIPYLKNALESVINQTYSNLEILLIDDGSTDESGKLCDIYAKLDPRIKVYHTSNNGLSAARNIGLQHCTGEYIAFLDSDDWLENNALELMLSKILSVDADIAVCYIYHEFSDYQEASNYPEYAEICEGTDILRDYLHGKGLNNGIWTKLYKRNIFEQIRFPEGRYYEDLAVTYKLLSKAKKLIRIQRPLIHYRQRRGSITQSHSLKNLTDYWLGCHEKYEALIDDYADCRVQLTSECIYAIGRFWRWYYGCKEDGTQIIKEMQDFIKKHKQEVLSDINYSRQTRFSCHMAEYSNPIMFWLLYYMNQVYWRFHRKRLFD